MAAMKGGRLTSTGSLTGALVVLAAAIFAPLWVPLILAAWFADLLAPAVKALERTLGGRRRAAAAAVVLLSVAIALPAAGMLGAVASGVHDLLDQVRGALQGRGSLSGALLRHALAP